jgi:chromosome segregation ATPase
VALAKLFEDVKGQIDDAIQGLSEKHYDFAQNRLEAIKSLLKNFDSILHQNLDYVTDPNLPNLDLVIKTQTLERSLLAAQGEIKILSDATNIDGIRAENKSLRAEILQIKNQILEVAKENRRKVTENEDLKSKVRQLKLTLKNRLVMAELSEEKRLEYTNEELEKKIHHNERMLKKLEERLKKYVEIEKLLTREKAIRANYQTLATEYGKFKKYLKETEATKNISEIKANAKEKQLPPPKPKRPPQKYIVKRDIPTFKKVKR